MQNPKVSIIVPVYNVENFLDQCIKSLIEQTLHEIEIILIDDGSKDKSPLICDAWAKKDSRIKVFHKKNEGVSCARNFGLTKVTGEYIAFVDSDDYVEKNMYQKLYEKCKTKNIEFCIFGYNEEYTTNKFTKRFPLEENNNDNPNTNIEEKEIFFDKKNFKNWFAKIKLANAALLCSPFNKLYKYNLLNGEEFKKKFFMGEDYLFNLQIYSKIKNALIINSTPYYYRFNQNSLTKTKYTKEKFYQELELMNETFKFYKKNKIFNKYVKEYYSVAFYGFMRNLHNWLSSPKEILCEMKNSRKYFSLKSLFCSINKPLRFCYLFLYFVKCYKILIKIEK